MLKKIRSLSRGGTLPTDSDVTGADGPVTYEGKLTLPGPVALQSTEYWCKLIGDKLFYYKNSQDTPHGNIDINQAQCVRRSSHRSKGFGIKIVTSRGRSMSLVASREEEREKWLQTLLSTVGTCAERRVSVQRSASEASNSLEALPQRIVANGSGADHTNSSDEDDETFHQTPDDCHMQASTNKKRPQLGRMPRMQTVDDGTEIANSPPGKIATSYEPVQVGVSPPAKGGHSLPISEAYEDIVLPPQTSTVHVSRDSGYSDTKNESNDTRYEEVFVPARPKVEVMPSKDEGLCSASLTDQVEYAMPSTVHASCSQGQGHSLQHDVSSDESIVMRRLGRQPSRTDSTNDVFLPTTTTTTKSATTGEGENDEQETEEVAPSSDVISKQLSRLMSEVRASSSSTRHDLRHSLADAHQADSHLEQLKRLLAGAEGRGDGASPAAAAAARISEAGSTAADIDNTTVCQLKNFLFELDA